MEEEELSEVVKVPWSWGNRFIGMAGLVAVLTIINLLAIFLGWLSPAIITSIWLFISLPIFITFVWSLFKNKPNAQIRTRKYGSILYIILAMGGFFFYHNPESFMNFWKLFAQFGIGFLITFVAGSIYLFLFILLKEKSYRIRAGVSFSASLISTILLIILTKDLSIFKKLIG